MLPFGNISERIFTHMASHYACKHTTILAVWQGRKCRLRTAEPHPPFSFPRKKTGGVTVQKKGVCIASEQLEELQRLPMLLPARGGAAFEAAIRFASAPTTRCCAAVGGSAALRMRHTPCGCRSAHLVEVQPNFRLPEHSTMRQAQQCRYFARSLPPC